MRAVLDAEPDLRVVGEAGDGPTALSLAVVLNPDMVVLEASLPGMGGVQLAARLRETRPEQKVLALTACEDAVSVRLLLSVGAQGYALKRSPTQQLLQAVRAVAAGGTHVDPAVAAAVAETPAPALSGRELQVLRLIALGYSNKEIGVRLKVSVKTIETHKTRAMEKLDLRGRVALVRYAAACGWLDEPPEPREQSAPPTS